MLKQLVVSAAPDHDVPATEFYRQASSFVTVSNASRIAVFRQFIQMLDAYDGTRNAFSIVFAVALTHLGISQNELAKEFDTATITVARWARGGAPSPLARVTAIDRIRRIAEQQLARLEQELVICGPHRKAPDKHVDVVEREAAVAAA